MNHELHLIAKIVRSQDPNRTYSEVMEASGYESMFLTYDYIMKDLFNYNSSYGKLPDEQTLKDRNPDVQFPDTPEPLNYYIDEVKRSFVYSRMTDVNDMIVTGLKANDPVEAYRKALAAMHNITALSRVSTDVNITTSVDERIQHYTDRRNLGVVSGIPSGWLRIDQETTGWHKGELTFLVGRMGSFKTWVMIAWATWAWQQGFTPIFFSKEMGVRQISRRIDTYLTSTRFKDIKTGLIKDVEFDHFKHSLVATFNGKHPFYVIDSSGKQNYDTAFILSKVQEYRPSIVFIDGVYMLRGDGESDWERQTSITRDLKQICLSEDVPIIGSTQASRGAAGKKSKIGTQHVAYSDSYGQDADNMIALNRIWDKILDKYTNRILVELIKVRDAENVRMEITVDLDMMKLFESANQISGPQSAIGDEVFDDDGDLMI